MEDRKRVEDRIYISNIRKEVILDKCKGICIHCGKKIKVHDDFSVEHIIPLSKGGTNDLINLVALCKECNKSKANDIVPPNYYEKAHKVLMEEIKKHTAEYMFSHKFINTDNVFIFDSWDFTFKYGIGRGKKTIEKKEIIKVELIREETEITDFTCNFVNLSSELNERTKLSAMLDENAIEHKLHKFSNNGNIIAVLDQHLETIDETYNIPDYKDFNVVRLTLMTDNCRKNNKSTTGAIVTGLKELAINFARSLSMYKAKGIYAIVIESLLCDRYGNKVLMDFSKLVCDDCVPKIINRDGLDYLQIFGCFNMYELETDNEETEQECFAREKRYRHEIKRMMMDN